MIFFIINKYFQYFFRQFFRSFISGVKMRFLLSFLFLFLLSGQWSFAGKGSSEKGTIDISCVPFFGVPFDCGLGDCQEAGTYLEVNGEIVEYIADPVNRKSHSSEQELFKSSEFRCERSKELLEKAISVIGGSEKLFALKMGDYTNMDVVSGYTGGCNDYTDGCADIIYIQGVDGAWRSGLSKEDIVKMIDLENQAYDPHAYPSEWLRSSH